ncbi:MYB transcription factor 08 [Mycena sanguinolenta]|uniref:MYB transcription factor 08 n=1 Tax=Mycena sanguinolenta TaxID=230812 RepID=A0A8H7D4R7_9AGAR|nr:MYB transcription factor 08 [Mycena sanguinolenta]
MGKKKEDSTKVSWSDSDDARLVDFARIQRTWAAIRQRVEATGLAEFKKAFLEVKKLRGLSGFGWDDGRKMVTASDEIWDAYIAAHEKAAYWRKHPYPLYDEMLILVEGVVATGASVFHAGSSTMDNSQTTANNSQNTSGSSPDTSDNSQGTSQGSSGMDTEAGDTSIDTLVNDDLTPSSPAVAATPAPSRKRAASSSPADGGARRHKRNADAASEIAGALQGVALSLNATGSPEVRRRAIKQMEDDAEFSEEEQVNIMRLFTRDTAVAQTYIASSKKHTRVAFICSVLDDDIL